MISIAVVGAGIAGLICTRILQKNDIDVTVFEAEAGFDNRPQGGALDIHADSGQQAIEAAGLTEAFRQVSSNDASSTKMFNANTGEVLYAGKPGGEGWNPEIDRGTLRRMLLDSLREDTVKWDAKVKSVAAFDDGGSEIVFANGEKKTFDLIIGADGTWSKVRPMLTKQKPKYSGVFLVESRIENWRHEHPDSWEMIYPGSTFAVGKSSLMMVHSGTDAWVSAGFNLPEDWAESVDWNSSAAAKAAVLHKLDDWDGKLSDMIKHATLPLTPRPMYVLPVTMRWKHKPGFTLIGDAAHVMPIFAGRGANLALLDGALLAEAIVEGGQDIHAAVKKAEQAMFKRTWKPALISMLALNQYFGPNAAKRVAYTFSTVHDGTFARIRRLTNMFTSSMYMTGSSLFQRDGSYKYEMKKSQRIRVLADIVKD